MRVFWVTAVVIVIDQITKIMVATSMLRGESISVIGDWLRLTYTLNPGMAFGITVGPPGMITVFSIAATLLIVYYLLKVRTGYAPYRYSLGLLLGGALGNIIDRVFYGVVFEYGPLFQGQVVDFIHVNLWRGYIPESIPLIGGTYAALFPIWNVADMAIVVSVVGILVFQHKFHELKEEEHRAHEQEQPALVMPEPLPPEPPLAERRAAASEDPEWMPANGTDAAPQSSEEAPGSREDAA